MNNNKFSTKKISLKYSKPSRVSSSRKLDSQILSFSLIEPSPPSTRGRRGSRDPEIFPQKNRKEEEKKKKIARERVKYESVQRPPQGRVDVAVDVSVEASSSSRGRRSRRNVEEETLMLARRRNPCSEGFASTRFSRARRGRDARVQTDTEGAGTE